MFNQFSDYFSDCVLEAYKEVSTRDLIKKFELQVALAKKKQFKLLIRKIELFDTYKSTTYTNN